MKATWTFFYITLLMGLLMACKPSQAFREARKTVLKHHSVAVLPPAVQFESYKTLSPTKLQSAEQKYAFDLQQKIVKRLQKKAKRQKCTFEIMPVEKTNKLLAGAGYFDDEEYTASGLCELLQVDGVIFTEFLLFNLDEGPTCCLLPIVSRGKEITMYVEILDSQSDVPVYLWDYTIHESNNEHYVSRWMIRDIIRIGINSLPYFEYQLIR